MRSAAMTPAFHSSYSKGGQGASRMGRVRPRRSSRLTLISFHPLHAHFIHQDTGARRSQATRPASHSGSTGQLLYNVITRAAAPPALLSL